jgi:D-sedoheptulose 7-phosphate isomerase
MIDEDVAPFVTGYLERLADVVDRVDTDLLARVCRLLRDTIAVGRRVCAVGNGGSSAIARAMSFQLRCHAEAQGHRWPVALDVGDQHEIAYRADRGGYASALSDMVWRRGLTAGDTVIAISMSGRSPNVLALARDAQQRGVRVVGFTGGDGGDLPAVTSWCVRTGLGDQQISEDAVLAWLTLAIDATMAHSYATRDLRAAARQAAQRFRRMAHDPMVPAFLADLSGAVVRAMLARRVVLVVCGQGGPLGWVAEHLAHNLYWDVPTGTTVTTPTVIGAASVADLTAIHNDHPDRVHGVRHRLAGVSPGDVVCGIADASDTLSLRESLAVAETRAAATHLITARHPTPHPAQYPARPIVLGLDTADAWELSTLVQPIGHLLCRLSGQRLRDTTRDHRGSSLADLLATDLAPRRTHHAIGTVA